MPKPISADQRTATTCFVNTCIDLETCPSSTTGDRLKTPLCQILSSLFRRYPGIDQHENVVRIRTCTTYHTLDTSLTEVATPYHSAVTIMNVFCGEHLSDDTIKETETLNKQTRLSQRRLERQIPIDIVLQSSHNSPYPRASHTRSIASSLPWLPLKAAAPKLIDHLTPCATSLVFPSSPVLDAHLLVNYLALIISQHETGSVPALDLDSLPPDPISLIKLHIIVELLGLEWLAGRVLERLWTAVGEGPVTLEHVFWVWGTMGEEQNGLGKREWAPRSGELYMQMMAWGVLNADREGRLDEQVRTFLVGEEGKKKVISRMLEERWRGFGAGWERAMRERADSGAELSDGTSVGELTTKKLTSIFPTLWLCEGDTESLLSSREQGDGIETLFSHWKWDGKVKNVKRMAADRDRLVRLRKNEAFKEKKLVFPPYPGYVYLT